MKKGYLDETNFTNKKQRLWEITDLPDKKGRPLRIKASGSSTPKGKNVKNLHIVEKLVWGIESNHDKDDKVILIEQFRDKYKTIRFGYRTWTHKTGKWHWGQYALWAPMSDIQELLAFAKSKGIELF
jgi:hypothetical protein